MGPVSADLEPLWQALEACDTETERIQQTIVRLARPPLSLHFSAADDAETAECIKLVVGFVDDEAARMLRLNEGKPDPEAGWAHLTRSERKRAERLWNWALKPDDLSVVPRGQPPKIDSALVLWCSRVLVEGIGRSHLAFSRPVEFLPAREKEQSGQPKGPEWQALSATLKFVQVLIDRVVPTAAGYVGAVVQIGDPRHAETIAQIAKLDRKSKDRSAKIFAKACRSLGLGSTADDVANHPQAFRFAVMMARVQRHRTRSLKPPRPRRSERFPD
jgi:hypothetical protein